jgi:hypothetical protein
VEQDGMTQIRRRAQRAFSLEQLGAADGKKLLDAQAQDLQPRLAPIAMPDGHVDVFARKIDVVQ